MVSLFKSRFSMFATEEGIDICLSDVHPLNANSPMPVTDAGISTSSKQLQSSNAYLPISVTERGILTPDSDEHPRNV